MLVLNYCNTFSCSAGRITFSSIPERQRSSRGRRCREEGGSQTKEHHKWFFSPGQRCAPPHSSSFHHAVLWCIPPPLRHGTCQHSVSFIKSLWLNELHIHQPLALYAALHCLRCIVCAALFSPFFVALCWSVRFMCPNSSCKFSPMDQRTSSLYCLFLNPLSRCSALPRQNV